MGIKLRAELARFASLIEDLASKAQARSEAGAAGGVAEMVREVAEKSGMLEALKAEGTPEADSRIENIRELVTVAADYARSTEDPSLASFLENAALLAAIDVMKEGDDGVILMTVHNAKGLEFPNVFVVGLEQGLFPHSRSFEEPGGLEEERRLCYVAMTRAMDRLYLTHARERTLYGFSRPGEPSLFLTEVPCDALFVASPVAHPEVVGWEEATSGGKLASLRAGKVRAEERARVRAESEADKATPTRAGSAPSSGRKETSTARFCPGERVVHPRWGEGTIVGMSRIGARAGSPGDLQLRVAFPGKGVQTFPASEVERRER
jgi:DNA helicase-2/ATP-dependent DNA helicase PcrA